MLHHTGTIPLSAPGLLLRRFTEEDATAMFANWASDPNVTRFLTWRPHPSVDETRAVLARWIPEYAQNTYYHWLIAWEGVPVGAINLHGVSDHCRRAEAGYCVGSRFWSRGIATTALGLVADFAFGTLGLTRLTACHDTENPASGRVMEKTGMVREGILRRHQRRNDDTFGDLACWGILREEWAARRATASRKRRGGR